VADAPWRCSECGTVNEPVANACRTCGRWPSLFDLEQSKVDVFEEEPAVANEPALEDFEVETYEELPVEPVDPAQPAEPESPSARGRRIFGSIIVPLAVVIYLVITFIVNR
jgi:predicted ATP-dependent serine protease